MLATKFQTIDNKIEEEYSRLNPIEHRKKYAQFFTPYSIADFMAKWILGNKELKNVLEPAFGLGIFSRILLNYNKTLNIKGFEVDEKIFDVAVNFFQKNHNIDIKLNDYICSDWESKYDGIICNPPYFKFHDYDNKTLLKEIEEKIGFKLSGFTNLYAIFLLKSIYQLAANGRAAYIVPSEFLNSDYGKLVKSYLVKSKTLRHIIVINFNENVFDDALTTASILLLANDGELGKVQFTNVNSVSEIKKLDRLIQLYPDRNENAQTVNFEHLNPEIKWKSFYQKQNSPKYKNLVPFSDFGKVVRGIATGANDYFVFNRSKAKKIGIENKYLIPCITRAIDAKTNFFRLEDFNELEYNDKPVYLLNAVEPIDKNVSEYIALGEKEEINKKFLTATRKPWYSLEKRPPSPIWVSVFNRSGLRFIKNEAGLSNLTTFHCIYPNKNSLFSDIHIDLLFAYLITDIAKEIFEDNQREYGNGLMKFEPNDINKAKILDLNQLNQNTRKEILENFYLYRQNTIENESDDLYIDKNNDILSEYFIRPEFK